MQDLHNTSYLPRAEARSPSGRRQPVPGRTLGAQGQRPGGAINPHARKGVSTFGNTGKHRPAPIPESPFPTPHPLYIAIEKFHRFPSRNLISLKSPLFYEYQHFSNYPAGERKIRMAEGRILSIPFSCHLVYDYLRYNILCLYFYF